MAILQKQKFLLGEELKRLQEMDAGQKGGITTIKGTINVKQLIEGQECESGF